MNHQKRTNRQRQRRSYRIRNRLRRDSTRPRLCVFRSHKHMYAQIVDDVEGRTLAAASSRADGAYGGNKAAAEKVGQAIAQRALEAGIKDVKFDRGDYKYHGRVAALADAARKAGLNF